MNKLEKFYNILIVGVGGQGVITLGKFFQEYAFYQPKIIKFAAIESRGVSQREGSVFASIRYLVSNNSPKNNYENKDGDLDDKSIFFSGNPPKGQIHLMIALEFFEFLRNANYCHPQGIVLLNLQQIFPKSAVKQKIEISQETNSYLQQIRDALPNLRIISQNYSEMLNKQIKKSSNGHLNSYMLSQLLDVNISLFPAHILKEAFNNFFS
ncbi:MAG: hypothetical protein K9W44_12635 [Candidatus Lokiarchaeota archaeon]|nr:hypothetical protein [Candidatus Harpocratesius repetitus]